MRKFQYVVMAAAALTMVGCAQKSQSLFYWGEYQDNIYAMYNGDGSVTPQEQIADIERDLLRAQEQGKRIAPGIQAHLGYMYLLEGNEGAGYQAFQREKQMYPESTVFIDGMIQRAQQAKQTGAEQ